MKERSYTIILPCRNPNEPHLECYNVTVHAGTIRLITLKDVTKPSPDVIWNSKDDDIWTLRLALLEIYEICEYSVIKQHLHPLFQDDDNIYLLSVLADRKLLLKLSQPEKLIEVQQKIKEYESLDHFINKSAIRPKEVTNPSNTYHPYKPLANPNPTPTPNMTRMTSNTIDASIQIAIDKVSQNMKTDLQNFIDEENRKINIKRPRRKTKTA